MNRVISLKKNSSELEAFAQYLTFTRQTLDEFFESSSFFSQWHPTIAEASKHVLCGSGKGLRPAIVLLTSQWIQQTKTNFCFVKPDSSLLATAAAVEMIHTYSLVHDDLPCMDNDDWRRGRPTLHRLYNEATAVLTGDSLLTAAFELLTTTSFSAEQKIRMIAELSQSAGPCAMISGQQNDLQQEKIFFDPENHLNPLLKTHREKTGALLGASFYLGAISGGCLNDTLLKQWRNFGIELGLLFQVIDDILDTTASATLGKTLGKDERQNKWSFALALGDQKQSWIEQKTEQLAFMAKTLNAEALLLPLISFVHERRA